jgi:hypothetical protein
MSFQSITAARLSDRMSWLIPAPYHNRLADRTRRLVVNKTCTFACLPLQKGLKAVHPPMLPTRVSEMLISNFTFRGKV